MILLALLLEGDCQPDILPQPQRRVDACFISINLRSLPYQIRLVRLDKWCPLPQLESTVQHNAHEAHGVVCHERTNLESVECRVSVNGERHTEEYDTRNSDVWLTPSFVRKRVSADILGFERAVEEDVYGAYEDVVHELGGLRDIGKPFHAFGGSTADGEEAK